LIAVLLIMVVLSAIILEFNYASRINLHIADNSYKSRQAFNCAASGINIAVAVLRKHPDFYTDDSIKELLTGKTQLQIEEGYCTLYVEEENAKININQLKTRDNQVVRRRVNQMLRLIDVLNSQYGEKAPISYGIVPAIIDWVDTDDYVTRLGFVKWENEGAEEDYYDQLEVPYLCKNGPFDMLGELLLVKGMTREIFEGRPGDESRAVMPVPGMREFLTIYGDGKIDINHAPAEVIQSLSEGIDSALAQIIVARRELGPFRSVQELAAIPGMTPEIFRAIRESVTVRPATRYYRVVATGVVDDFTRKIQVIIGGGSSRGRARILLWEEL